MISFGGAMKSFKRYIPVVLLILHCGLIFFFSSQNAESSSGMSKGLLRMILELTPVVKNFSEPMFLATEHIVRKTAHFVLYLILGIYAYLSAESVDLKRKLLPALLFCLVYAASDEFHQLFTAGRSGQISDVCLDFCGSSVGVGITTLIKKKLKKEE